MEFCVAIGDTPDVKLTADLSKAVENSGFSSMTVLDSPGKTIDVHLMLAIAAYSQVWVQEPYCSFPWM